MKLLVILPLAVFAVYRCARVAERLFDEIAESVKVI